MRRRDQTKRTKRMRRTRMVPGHISSDVTERGILLAFTKDPLAQAVYDYDLDMIDS